MNVKEQALLSQIHDLVVEIKSEGKSLKESTAIQIAELNQKVEKKQSPIYLEQDILRSAQVAIADSIKAALGAYNSPMQKLVLEVVTQHNSEIKILINDAFTSVIRTDEFKKSIVNAFSHKVARSIISNNDGLFDKVSNDLKQDAIFKSKMAIAVSNVVEECLIERKGINQVS